MAPTRASGSSRTRADAHFQPYVLPILLSRGSSPASVPLAQHLVAFPTQRRKLRFVLFLRDFCAARRRADWAAIPEERYLARALEYAAFHRCMVYDLAVRMAPAAGGVGGRGRRVCVAEDHGEDSDECRDEEGEEVEVVDQDMKSFLTD